jgi:hypothetical protein
MQKVDKQKKSKAVVGFGDRIGAAAAAKQALLDKFRANKVDVTDPAFIEQQAVRAAAEAARAERDAQRRAEKDAAKAQVLAERKAAQEAAEAQVVADHAAREAAAAEAEARKIAKEAEAKAARDARYAARKARK